MVSRKDHERKISEQIAQATERARLADAYEPRAISASYDRESRRIIVELSSGATLIVPAILCEGLAGASAKELAHIELTPARDGLRWKDLDVDLGLPALMNGIYGTAEWMVQMEKRRSQKFSGMKSEAKGAGSKQTRLGRSSA